MDRETCDQPPEYGGVVCVWRDFMSNYVSPRDPEHVTGAPWLPFRPVVAVFSSISDCFLVWTFPGS